MMQIQEKIIALILKELDIKIVNLNDFRVRKKIQKSIFLLQHSPYNIELGYHFNLYIHGPYSPALAECYYNISFQESNFVRGYALKDDVLEIISKFKKWTEKAAGKIGIELTDCLELLSTVLFLYKYSFTYISNHEGRKEKIKQYFKAHKPHFSESQISGAINLLKSNNMITVCK